MPIPRIKRATAFLGSENLFLIKSSPELEKAGLEFGQYTLAEGCQTAWALGISQRSQKNRLPRYLTNSANSSIRSAIGL